MFHSFDMSTAIGNDDHRVKRENILAHRMIATSYLASNCEDADGQSARSKRRRKRLLWMAWSGDCLAGLDALEVAASAWVLTPMRWLRDDRAPTPLMCN